MSLNCFHFIKFNKSIWGKKKKFHSSSNFDPVTSLKLHTANSTSGWEGTKCPYFYIDFPTLKKGRKKLSGKWRQIRFIQDFMFYTAPLKSNVCAHTLNFLLWRSNTPTSLFSVLPVLCFTFNLTPPILNCCKSHLLKKRQNKNEEKQNTSSFISIHFIPSMHHN